MKVRSLTLALLILLPALTGSARAETLSLGRALELAKKTAPSLAIARADVDGADARVTIARAGYVPSLSANVSGSTGLGISVTPVNPKANGGDPLFTRGYTAYGATGAAHMRWTLWDFARGPHNAEANAGLEGAAIGLRATEAEVIAHAATTYMNVVFLNELRELAAATVAQREKMAIITKALVKAGVQPPLEEIRSQSRLEAARRDLANSDSDLKVVRVQLALLVGADPATPIAVSAPRFKNELRTSTEAAMQQAEKQHPSVRAADVNVRVQDAQADQAFARYLPVLSLAVDGRFSYSYADPGNLVIPDRDLSGQLALSIPIFDLGTVGNVGVARADARGAAANLLERKRAVRSDAAQASEALISAEAVVEHAKKAAENAAIVVAVVQARYQQGLSSALDLINAEGDDVDAKSAQIRADLSRSLAAIRLLTATGNAKKLEGIQ
jgi:outer membrane protein